MGDFEARCRIKKEAIKRVVRLRFGQPVTNVCAGDRNPMRHSYFVKVDGNYVEVTDKDGAFSTFGVEVIYPGHLSIEKADELYKPFWEAQFGSRPTVEAKP
jgi:hypothetical protein